MAAALPRLILNSHCRGNSEIMPILKEQIARRVKGSMGEKEDWWWLCYDTERQSFYVEHEWDHVSQGNLNQNAGSTQFDAESWKGEGASNMPEARRKIEEKIGR